MVVTKNVTDLGNGQYLEVYTGTGSTTWTIPSGGIITSMEILIVGGGGSSGGCGTNTDGGAGGAGGLLYGTLTTIPSITTIVVGAGGTAPAGYTSGNNGGNSSFGSYIAYGGGGGGTAGAVGKNGGSGGGAGGSSSATSYGNPTQTSQSPLIRYGFRGGGSSGAYAGGGGGATGVGITGFGGTGGTTGSGPGYTCSITGSAIVYAKGGQRSSANGTNGLGNGGDIYPASGQPGRAGGSGTVILKYTLLYDPLKIYINQTTGTDPLTVSYAISIRNPLTNFTLSYGDGQIYTSDSQSNFPTTHVYNEPGTYTVWAEGYTEFATHLYYEIPYGITVSAPSVSTYFTFTQNENVIQFHDETIGSPNEWYWTFGDGTHSYEQHPIHAYNTTGLYQVNLWSSNQYQYDSSQTNVNISSIKYVYSPLTNFKPSYINIITDDLPVQVQFTNLTYPGTGCTYLWDFGDGQTSTAIHPTHNYTSTGIYHVSLTATNTYGGSSITYHNCIRIHNEAKIFIEYIDYNDGHATMAVKVFEENVTSHDIHAKAKVFTESVSYTQSEFPSTPGIDEYCNLSFDTRLNEYCEMIYDDETDYVKLMISKPTMSMHGFLTVRAKLFEENVYYTDVFERQ